MLLRTQAYLETLKELPLRPKHILCSLAVLLACAVPAFADDDDDDDEANEEATQEAMLEATAASITRDNLEIRLKPLGFGLMGDSMDDLTGSLRFTVTDVSIPGNSDLPVAIKRVATDPETSYAQKFYMGDWDLFVPNVTVVRDGAGDWTNTKLNTEQYGSETVFDEAYGYDFDDDNGWDFDQPRWSPFTRSEIAHVTASHTVMRKFGSAASSDYPSQSAYWAHTPDGKTYKFARVVSRDAGDYFVWRDSFESAKDRKTRSAKVYLATEVTDRNGNWVKYDYTTDGKLTQIHSNDGRSISLSYLSGTKYVSSVTANGRTWTYSYVTVSDPDRLAQSTRKVLHKVTQPDGLFWEYDISNLTTDFVTSQYANQIGTSEDSITVDHPYGATAEYKLEEVRLDFVIPPEYRVNNHPPYTYTAVSWWTKSKAAVEKKVSIPAQSSSIWTYSYVQAEVSSLFSTRTHYKPDGSRLELTLVPQGGSGSGQPIEKKTFDTNGGLLQTVTYDYVRTFPIGASSSSVDFPTGEEWDNSFQYYLEQKIIVRGADTWTTEYDYDLDPWSTTYSYGKPSTARSWSNVSTLPRETVTTFLHEKDDWVLNLPGTITRNNRLVSSYSFDALGQLDKAYRYGQLYADFNFNSDGTLASKTDPLSRVTSFQNWKRGRPQRTNYADATYSEQIVDNNGWATSVRDQKGNITTIGRDNMGRLTQINKPSSYWLSTNVAYAFPTSGGALQTITTGSAKETVTYDPLLRTKLVREQSIDTNWQAYTNTQYDLSGRKSFQSFPSTSATSSIGTTFTYDGLGRPKTTVTSDGTTQYQYLSSHRTRIIDPKQDWVDRYHYGWSGPNSSAVKAIFEYGNGAYQRKTDIDENVWGQITEVNQYGNMGGFNVNKSQHFYYDSTTQRLCRYRTVEGGDTVYEYDAAGQMVAYQEGLTNGTACSNPTGNSKVSLGYDNLGRLLTTDFADLTPDILRTYDANGNKLSVDRGIGVNSVDWTYSYDNLNNLVSETLDIDGKSFATSYEYTPNDQLRYVDYPSGNRIDQNPNAVGQASMAQWVGVKTIASSMDYHPNGMLQDFAFGNGHNYLQTLDVMQRPLRVSQTKGALKAFDRTYGYDVTGRVSAVTDHRDASYNLSYDYDPLGPLIEADGKWGQGSFSYDSLGNIRSKQLGARTVAMSYDSNNRMTSYTDSGTGPNKLLSYDSRGNVTALGGQQFSYDLSGQPNAISGTASGTYIYDGNRKRVKAVVNGDTRYTVYSAAGSLIHKEKTNGGGMTDYIKVAGVSIARVGGTTASSIIYLHKDHLGSIAATSGASGALTSTEHFSPFGEALDADPLNGDEPGFTEHVRDVATGLNYMQARYQDPVSGRFLSVDPVTFLESQTSGQFNRYSYCYNSVLQCVDPDGELGILGAGVGAALGGVIGAVAGSASEYLVQRAAGGEVDWGAVAAKGAIGGVAGAATGAFVGSGAAVAVAVGANVGALAGGANMIVDAAMSGKEITGTSVAVNMVGGAIVGGVLGGTGGPLPVTGDTAADIVSHAGNFVANAAAPEVYDDIASMAMEAASEVSEALDTAGALDDDSVTG